MQKQTIQVDIDGMSCGHCVKTVRQALESVEGVDVLSVEIGKAVVALDGNLVDRSRLKDEIDATGFEVRSMA